MDALHDVTLELRPGSVVALVGENGSGKTTLAKVMAGLFLATQGTLWWDRGGGAVLVDTERVAELRAATALVSQSVHETQWPVSAREHVAFGDVTRLDDHAGVVAAAADAGADTMIASLAHGWSTLLNSGFPDGTDLSGGQWQRLAIARAFFRDAPLVILDEPTAALDAKAEHAVFERVKELTHDRAVLLISHRFSTVRMADRIVVLAQGRVIEQGSHDELMAITDGHYAEMYRLQRTAFLRDEP